MEFRVLGGEDRKDIGESFAAFGLDGLPGGDGGIELGLAGIPTSLAGGDLLVGQTMFDGLPVEADFLGTIGTDEAANARLVDDNDMMHNAHTALGANAATRGEIGNEVVIRRRVVFRKGRRRDGEKTDDAGGSEGSIHRERWVGVGD